MRTNTICIYMRIIFKKMFQMKKNEYMYRYDI